MEEVIGKDGAKEEGQKDIVLSCHNSMSLCMHYAPRCTVIGVKMTHIMALSF